MLTIREVTVDKLTDEQIQMLTKKYNYWKYTPKARKPRLITDECKYLESIYHDIKTRCRNKNSVDYKNYGGRGITTEFTSTIHFIEYVLSTIGHRPSGRYCIDRVDNDKNYAPGNLRWATYTESNRNRRNVKAR